MTPLILYSVADGVARFIFNRPEKRNALTRELLGELANCLSDVAARSDVRCLVLSGNGPWFCAGMDLAQMQETATFADAPRIWQQDTQLYRTTVETLFQFPFPTLSVVRGGALAGGLGMALACDLTLAAESAIFALPEPKRGITAAIVTPLLVRRIGAGQAAYVLLSGETLHADEARQRGICHLVAPDDQLELSAERLIRSILSGAPGALQMTKQQLHDCACANLSEQFVAAAHLSALARETTEAREGLAAFLEKRPPAWQPSTTGDRSN